MPSSDNASEPARKPSGTSSVAARGVRLRAWHVAALALLVAVGGLLLYGFWPALTGETAAGDDRPDAEDVASSVAAVDVVVARRTDFPLRTEATGRLAPWRRAVVSAEADGRILARPVEEGQYVDEGALLVRLDDRDERIELVEAEAELTKARAEYAVNAEAAPARAAADTSALTEARKALREAEAAFDEGARSAEALRRARRRFEVARLRSGVGREAVQAATYGLAQAEQQVELARLRLARTRVRAPFAGRVANIEVEVGQRIAPGQEVVTLLDDRPMKVEVTVLEEDLVRLAEGATAQVHVPALEGAGAAPSADAAREALPSPSPGAVVEGTVFALNPLVDAERGTGRVTVAIPNPEGRLLTGLYARVRLEVERLEDRLVVPTDAVLLRQGRDLVFVVEGDRAAWTYVEVGARSGDFVAVTQGISPGDTIAVDGHFALAHDAPVEVAAVREVDVP